MQCSPRAVWIVKTQDHESCFPGGVPGLASHEVHTARCELQGRISARCGAPSLQQFLWLAVCTFPTLPLKTRQQLSATDLAYICDFCLFQGNAVILKGFSACIEN